jgi:hypothetical protein
MSWDAYVFGDLQWPMPDPGLVAVWRAMTLEPDRWDDWGDFGSAGSGTVGELLDSIAGARQQPGEVAPLEVVVDEYGVKLRAYLEKSQAYWWQPLATAWRLAADLGASGDFVWVPGEAGPTGIAYKGEIGDGESAWKALTGQAAEAMETLPGRREIDQVLNLRMAELGVDGVELSTGAPAAEIMDDVFAAGIDSLDDMFPSEAALSAEPTEVVEIVVEAVIPVEEPAVEEAAVEEEPAPVKKPAAKTKPAVKAKPAKAKPATKKKPAAKATPAAKKAPARKPAAKKPAKKASKRR